MDIERIQKLDKKIQEASDYIIRLREEKQALSSRFANYEQRISELESQLKAFQEQQKLIENSIENALTQLDILEEHMHTSSSQESDATLADDKTPTPRKSSTKEPVSDPIDAPEQEASPFWEEDEEETDDFSIFDSEENSDTIFSDNPEKNPDTR